MPDKDRKDPVTSPPRTADEERARMDETETPPLPPGQHPRRHSPRPDPRTGEVPAGPGDAGLQDRPELNAGSPGTQQMSMRRLGIGLGVAILLGGG